MGWGTGSAQAAVNTPKSFNNIVCGEFAWIPRLVARHDEPVNGIVSQPKHFNLQVGVDIHQIQVLVQG